MHLYANDNDGFAPQIADGNPQSSAAWDGWDFALDPYLQATFLNPWNNRHTLKPHPQSMGWQVAENLDKLKFYCPSYKRVMDVNGRTPSQVWNEPNVATWVSYWCVGSYRMNGWMGLYGVTTGNNRNYQLPGPHARLGNVRSSTLLMSEAWGNWGYTGRGSIYFNPNHTDSAPILFADTHTAVKAPADVPDAPCSWCINSPAEMAGQDPDVVTFWGLYLLKYYANPATYNW